MITHDRLKELLSYDRETGKFFWLVQRGTAIPAGGEAGYTRWDGYLILVIDGEHYLGHRAAWFYETGEWPEDMIDHRDGDSGNNRFANLREASRAQNMMNMALLARNTSGIKGVSFVKASGKWEAYINVDGKKRALGLFQNKEHAAQARAKAEVEHYGEFARCA